MKIERGDIFLEIFKISEKFDANKFGSICLYWKSFTKTKIS